MLIQPLPPARKPRAAVHAATPLPATKPPQPDNPASIAELSTTVWQVHGILPTGKPQTPQKPPQPKKSFGARHAIFLASCAAAIASGVSHLETYTNLSTRLRSLTEHILPYYPALVIGAITASAMGASAILGPYIGSKASQLLSPEGVSHDPRPFSYVASLGLAALSLITGLLVMNQYIPLPIETLGIGTGLVALASLILKEEVRESALSCLVAARHPQLKEIKPGDQICFVTDNVLTEQIWEVIEVNYGRTVTIRTATPDKNGNHGTRVLTYYDLRELQFATVQRRETASNPQGESFLYDDPNAALDVSGDWGPPMWSDEYPLDSTMDFPRVED